MIGQRTRYSLAQLLEQQEPARMAVLLMKHGGRPPNHGSFSFDIANAVLELGDVAVMNVLVEVLATEGDLRFHISPKHRFDARMHDLVQCLALDGYIIEGKRLRQTDPSITDAAPIDDDLIEALNTCGAPRASEVIQKISDSAQHFRASPPDYNGSLTNARVALETLAADVAADVASGTALQFDATSWGSILACLRQGDEISVEEEKGLAGVYRFVSPGAHRPVGISEEQMTRLGRSFALNMCWFLLQNRLVRKN